MANKILIGAVTVLLSICSFLLGQSGKTQVLGSVGVSDEYRSISIAANAGSGATTSPNATGISGGLKGGSGTLGSLVITGVATGGMTFYDATTSNITLRAAEQSTSSIILADVHSSAAVGTYVFDVEFKRGLLVAISGTAPTSTVTFR